EALKSYDSAIGIDPSDPFAWNGKGMILLQFGTDDQAVRAFDRALELNPSMESAAEGKRIVQRRLHEQEVSAWAVKVLQAEHRRGGEMTKEDAFRECGIPYSSLDEVFEYLEQPEPVDVNALSETEFADYEDLSRRVLLAAYRNPGVSRHGLRVSDVLMNLPDEDVATAKKVYSYIQRVNELEFRPGKPDPESEKLLRNALSLPEEKRSAVGLMENLGIGIYQARKLIGMMQGFRNPGRKAAPVKVKEMHEEEELVELDQGPAAPAKDLVERATEHKRTETRPARKPNPYEAPELYVRTKQEKQPVEKDEKEEAQEPKGRRCLFHGGLAVMKCPSCGSVLCKECTASGACPRCKTNLGTAPARKQRAEEPEGEEEESKDSAGPSAEQPRDWSRL
ncbi:MAG TPA: tetratricopeptide repeat protein, partial [Methanomassiliicoccales archaeon]|nr:tetratricopeptide repeat protein [Methanomassiliicoccales archaeon]